jgi:hypothetical protein
MQPGGGDAQPGLSHPQAGWERKRVPFRCHFPRPERTLCSNFNFGFRREFGCKKSNLHATKKRADVWHVRPRVKQSALPYG